MSLNKNRGAFELTLNSEDLQHLEKFKDAIGYCGEIHYKPVKLNGHIYDSHRLALYSGEFSKDLISLGCFEAKSLILKFPTKEQVPEIYLKDFLRGYTDGDGCIYHSHDFKKLTYSMLGTRDFLDSVSQYFIDIGITSKSYIYTHGNIFNYQVGCFQYCIEILNHLYKDSTIFLDRKYQKYLNIISKI